MDESEPSGKVSIDAGRLIWENQGKHIGEVVVSDICLIGEYTTEEGPVIDDWFIVFYMSKDDCKQISLYAKGREDMLKYLSECLGVEVAPRLMGSAGWNTTLLWPSEVMGQPMWNIENLEPETLGEKLKVFFGLGHPARTNLTDEALSVIEKLA
jgi:hypothetical protein